MKIAINCSYYFPKGGGIKEYIYNLVSGLHEILSMQLKDQLICYVAKDQEEFWIQTMPKDVPYKLTPYSSKDVIKRSFFQRYFWLKEEKKGQFDIFHSPFFYGPKLKQTPLILTVHDLRFKKYPETYTFLRLSYLRFIVPKAIKKCQSIIAISKFTKNEVIENFGISQQKIQVIYEAVNKNSFNEKNIINKSKEQKFSEIMLKSNEFILAVGHLEPRKNYERLIKAFKMLKQEGIEKKLVIVGQKSHGSKEVMTLIDNINIIYLGWVEFSELLWLYKNCLFHVFPSFYEGFGFPVLEAACFGKPTLGSKCTSISEIAGDGGVYFDPFSVQSIYEILLIATQDNKTFSEKSINAVENTNRYSWEKNAKETHFLYEKTFKDYSKK